MTVREELEWQEHKRLNPLAAFADQSRGRLRFEEPRAEDVRTCYQRDIDRIVHSKSFRRLMHKTQVFLQPEDDHYRTRMTHTLEVSRIAGTITRALGLNEDLAEAIAMGHDLGHTPFGHAGEDVLSQCLGKPFRHNEQSLRVAERLENDGQGLNLCRETLDGILNHSGQNEPKTLEGWCVRRADRIAYINHDIDDAIRGGILKPFELPRRCLSVLGETHGERIDTMIRDIVTTSTDQPFVRMSEEVRQASEELRAFLFEYVYHDEWRKKEEARCDYILSALYEHYLAHPEQLPAEYLEINFTEGAERAVCDFIACMTDRYAIDQFSEILVPGAFGRR